MEAFIKAGECIMRYSRVGKGTKVLVMLHGYGQSLDTFDDIAGQLGKSEFDVITIDLPGSGHSTWGERSVISVEYMASEVIALLDKIGVANFWLVGHSMGGYVASAMIETYSERLNGVMLFHSLPIGDTDERKAKREREIELLLADKKEMLAGINPLKGFAPHNSGRCMEQIEEKIEQFLMSDDMALVATLRGLMERKDRTEIVAKYAESHKLMIIFGEWDEYIPKDMWEDISQKLPKAQISILEHSAHMGYREEQERSIALIEELAVTI